MSHPHKDVNTAHSGLDLRKKVLTRAKLMLPIWHKQASGHIPSRKPDTVCIHTGGTIQGVTLYPVVTRHHTLPDNHAALRNQHLPAASIKHTIIDPTQSLDYTLVYISLSCDFFITEECQCAVTIEQSSPKRRPGIFGAVQSDDAVVRVTHLRTMYRPIDIGDINDTIITDINMALDKVRRLLPNSLLHRRMADIYKDASK